MRIAKFLTLGLVAAALSACGSVNMNVKDTPPEFPEALAFDGFVGTDGIRDYDGDILQLDFLGTGARKGELIHIDLWPFVGVGVGPLGFRAQILPLEFGIGTLFYEPSAPTGGGDGAEEGGE